MYCIEEFVNHPKYFICMQFEQLYARMYHFPNRKPSKELNNYFFSIFKKAAYIFDYSYSNSKFLKENDVDSITVPYGFSPTLSLHQLPKLINERQIDILWYGNICSRRKNILNNIKKVNVNIIESKLWDNKIKELGKISLNKTEVVKDTKIVLNIKYDDPSYSILETPRIIHAMSNGCLVISEYSSDSVLNSELKDHVVLCHHTQIENMCLFYLSNLDLLQEKVNKSYNWLSNNYKYCDKIPYKIIENLI